MIKFIDLCAGIGGFRLGFEPYSKCILTCEIDKFAKKAYLANFTDTTFHDDISTLDEKSIEDFNILCAGFPCQPFSTAGYRKGFTDTRGTIFFDIARIIEYKRPEVFLLENVKGLLNHKGGDTYKVISTYLDTLNYWHEVILVNAKYFVPQNRERIFIVGMSKEAFTEEEFNTTISSIRNKYLEIQALNLPEITDILETKIHRKYTIKDNTWEYLQYKVIDNGFKYGLIYPYVDTTTRTLTASYRNCASEILIFQEDTNPRKLIPRECARLMGFPESYEIVVSDSQAYKQFGNSVVVPIVSMFAEILTRELNKKLK